MASQSDHGANGATNAAADAALRELRVAIEHHARGADRHRHTTTVGVSSSANARRRRNRRRNSCRRASSRLKEALECLPVRALDPPSVQEGNPEERIVSLAIQTYFGEATTLAEPP